jgi:hypothetical protein
VYGKPYARWCGSWGWATGPGYPIQVPTQAVFYTTGPSRRLRLGQMSVVLKHVASRKLMLAGCPAGVALAALWYLGKRAVTEQTICTIAAQLEPQEFEALSAAKPMMPAWMSDVMTRFELGAQDG